MSENPTQSPVEGLTLAQETGVPEIEQSSATAGSEETTLPKAAGVGRDQDEEVAGSCQFIVQFDQAGVHVIEAVVFALFGQPSPPVDVCHPERLHH
jgi:hypothetical protein